MFIRNDTVLCCHFHLSGANIYQLRKTELVDDSKNKWKNAGHECEWLFIVVSACGPVVASMVE